MKLYHADKLGNRLVSSRGSAAQRAGRQGCLHEWPGVRNTDRQKHL